MVIKINMAAWSLALLAACTAYIGYAVIRSIRETRFERRLRLYRRAEAAGLERLREE